MKGGYKLINFKGVALTTGGDPVTIDGIYDAIENNYGKAELLAGLNIGGVEKPETYAAHTVSSGDYVFSTEYGTITVTSDDEVTLTANGGGGAELPFPVIDFNNVAIEYEDPSEYPIPGLYAVVSLRKTFYAKNVNCARCNDQLVDTYSENGNFILYDRLDTTDRDQAIYEISVTSHGYVSYSDNSLDYSGGN